MLAGVGIAIIIKQPDAAFWRAISLLLVQRVESANARFGVGARTGRVDANHCIFLGAERADTSLVDRERYRKNRVADVEGAHHRSSTSRELVTGLAAASRVAVVGQDGVNQASCGRARSASRAQRATEVGQSRSKPDSGVGGVV